MFNLDEEYLRDLGIADMPEDMKKPLVEGLEKQIQDRVSLRIAERLTDEQLEELARLAESGDEEAQVKWLEEKVPNYDEIIREVLIEVKDEILAQRAQVLES